MKYELKPTSGLTEILTVPLLPSLTLAILRVHPLFLPTSLTGTLWHMQKEDLNLLWKHE